jgi:hypothetical protein
MMMLIHFGMDNFGIHCYPICVGCYDTKTQRGAYYVIKPVEYWDNPESPRAECPTRNDALKYGLDVARVTSNLNRILYKKTVYTTNAIETVDCLTRIYESCGDIPTFEVENVVELIPIDRQDEYTQAIIELNQYDSGFPIKYCIDLDEILKRFLIDKPYLVV